jgi:4-hydroxy-tetrahydrodipicolinate synthase
MRPLKAQEINGTWATLLLPINADDSIDFSRLRAEIDLIIASGADGVYSNGTAGEFHNQSEAEFDEVSRLLAEACEAAQFPFQLGASHPSPKVSLERLRRTRALKPSAIQVILPDWFPVTEAEAVCFLERMADEADPIGLVLYNPPHAKRVLSPAQLASQSRRIPSLVGCKVGAGDQQWFDELGPAARQMSVFTPGHHLATHWPMGSSGAYSNVACINPRGAKQWNNLIINDLPAAQAFQRRLLSFFDRSITPYIMRDAYSNPAVDKLLATIGGWCDVGTRMRWPYRSIPEDHVPALRRAARAELPELFEK